jgi:quercetin dioxygenase-like cupin family protein
MTALDHFPPQITGLPAFDGPFAAHRLAAPGCDVLFASYAAGTVIGDHQHETDNVGVITMGQLILTVAGQERRYGPGDWYRVPAGTVHSARFDVDSAEIELWFQA